MLERDALRPKPTGGLPCEAWEAMLAEYLDGTLPTGEQSVFDQHTATCTGCAQLLVEASRGQEWMRLLDGGPESPADLVDKILLKTQGALPPYLADGAIFPGGTALDDLAALPGGVVAQPSMLLPRVSTMMLERAFHDARLLMTAAMAFFVIALTLSLFGFRLDTVKAAELKPQTLEASLTRQFYGTKKQVVSFYDNLRVVYEVESKMKELRRDAEPDAAPGPTPGAKAGGRTGTPTSIALPVPLPPGKSASPGRTVRLARRHPSAPGTAPASLRGTPVVASAQRQDRGWCGREARSEANARNDERSRA